MMREGKVYEKLMVDVKVRNHKLKERGMRMIEHVRKGCYEEGLKTVEGGDLEVKSGIVMLERNTEKKTAKDLVKKGNGDMEKGM